MRGISGGNGFVLKLVKHHHKMQAEPRLALESEKGKDEGPPPPAPLT